ncbi:UDP-N-acetylmuramate--alanine ligase [Phaeobacter sp. B1627]|uniref:UDP-N-acetylmuramate--alanine ligase n=1 Tax=Phaeobacter sp. B1627 TaxID=2583809 RepID=UPI00111B51F3|nr:UDP-N-acetylmuramate--alanine ligase [Phaeobacter sp. B1627]TNJ42659.1 UDP-N-acetylmuramate--alanine ligase [Phaeobacter sp. B1627]
MRATAVAILPILAILAILPVRPQQEPGGAVMSVASVLICSLCRDLRLTEARSGLLAPLSTLRRALFPADIRRCPRPDGKVLQS